MDIENVPAYGSLPIIVNRWRNISLLDINKSCGKPIQKSTIWGWLIPLIYGFYWLYMALPHEQF